MISKLRVSHHLFCSKPATLASRAEPLATVWVTPLPDEPHVRHPGSRLPQYAKCPPTPSFHTASSLLSLLFCLNPSLGSLPSSVRLCAQGHFRATFPSLSASQSNSPTDSSSLPFGLFYFSAHHCPALYIFFALSVSSHQNTSSKSVDTVRFCSLLDHQ